MRVVIRLVCEPRHRRRHRRRDRDAEQSDREIHQTKRVVEPGDGARALIGGQHRVDEDVDLCRRKADGPRKHEHQNASQAWIMRVERRTVAIAFARQGRPLDQQLSKTADERPNGDDHDGWHAVVRGDRDERQRTHDGADVEHSGRQGGHEEMPKRVQHAHQHRGERHQRQKRHHDARQLHRELEFPGNVSVVTGEEAQKGFREDDGRNNEDPSDEEDRVDHGVRKMPRAFACVCYQPLRKRGDEGGAHGAFREQVANQVGNAIRHVECVHRVSGAEVKREDLFTHQPEHAAGHRGEADDAGGACQARRSVGHQNRQRTMRQCDRQRTSSGCGQPQVTSNVMARKEKGAPAARREPKEDGERLTRPFKMYRR